MRTHMYRGLLLAAVSLSICYQARSEVADEELKQIVVTGTPLSEDPDFSSTITESVNRKQILLNGGANLADALANIPGVSGTTFASGASRPVIRGFDANRVRILEDGIGSFDVSDVGPDHGVPIDPLAAQRIEVVRGAATLRYGSQAIGGVVNAINDRVPLALPEKPLGGEVTAAYGTSADSKDASALLNGKAGSIAWHADGFVRRTHDYDTPDGVQGNSFFRGDGFSGGGSYFFGDSHVGLGVIHYDAKYGIPSDTTYIDMRQTKEVLRSSFAVGLGALKTINVDGGYGDYNHRERDPDGTVGSTFIDKEWDSRAEAIFEAMGPFSSTALGVQIQHKQFSALGEGADYLLPTSTKSAAVFGFTNAPLGEKLSLQLAARIERASVEGTPLSGDAATHHFTPSSGSVGLVFDPTSEVRLGLTASSAARAPAQTELFARGPHDGPGTLETGDPNLNVERANSIEGSLRWHRDAVRLEASIWGARFQDYIYGALTGRTCDDDGVCVEGDEGELRELIYGQSGATFYGTEGKLLLDVYRAGSNTLQLTTLADYVHATLSNGTYVPRIPPYHIGAGLTWQGTHFDAGFLAKYFGSHTEIATAETPTGGFFSLEANATWRPIPSYPHLQLSLIGHNLTDSAQRNSVALNKDLVLLPGRDIKLLFHLDF